MAQTLSQIYLHLIFSTKHRDRYLNKEVRDEVMKYIGGVLNNQGCQSIIVGGDLDHIHALFNLNRNKSVSEVVREVKSQSSKWITEKTMRVLHWQAGYGVFSVSHSQVRKVIDYIANQEEHHKRINFQEEFLKFLELHEIEYNVDYVFD